MFRTIRKKSRMTKLAVIAVLILLSLGSTVFAATINLKIETDHRVYRPGDVVSWTLYAWASAGDNNGVQFLSIELDDNTDDVMELPDVIELPPDNEKEFAGTDYGLSEGFMLEKEGTIKPDPERSDILDIIVMQMPIIPIADPNIGNDGQTDHVFMKGSFVVNEFGIHYLTVPRVDANYWSIELGLPWPFDDTALTPAIFTVKFHADVNQDDHINLIDFAMIAANWQVDDCGSGTDCGRTDLNFDGKVNLGDIFILADQWLSDI